jgi:hypothetical protein
MLYYILYITLGLYYICGIFYFVFNDYYYAKKNRKKSLNDLNFDKNELFDKLINNE